MESMCYIGLDVRKRTISYCVKDVVARFTQKARHTADASIRIAQRKLFLDPVSRP
jgi:hypothetical protein